MENDKIHSIELSEQQIVMILSDAGVLLDEKLNKFYYSRRKMYHSMFTLLNDKSKEFLCELQPSLVEEIHK